MKLSELAEMVERGEYEFLMASDFDLLGIKCDYGKFLNAHSYAVISNSIDAVERLRKELLPDSLPEIEHDIGATKGEMIVTCEYHMNNRYNSYGRSKTEAAARLAALLRALEGKENVE